MFMRDIYVQTIVFVGSAMDKIQFVACLKSSGKPIKFGNEGAAEIVLETASTETAAIMRMVGMTNMAFRVTIEEYEEEF